jgi:hypothetical protein
MPELAMAKARMEVQLAELGGRQKRIPRDRRARPAQQPA